MRSTRKETDVQAREALAATLREMREKVVEHAGNARVPRIVINVVEEMIDLIDDQVEKLVGDRDQDVEDAIADIGE